MHPAERTAHMSPSELTALRRKKNADAQAAFRKRRANYIATLEETVNNLEQVVRSLQETIQEAKMQEHDLKTENSRLKFELDSMRKAQQPPHHTQPPTPQRLETAPWSASGVGFRPPSQPSSLHHYPATTPSMTPPLSATNTSPSPAGSSNSSASTSTSLSTPYQSSGIQTPTNGYGPDDVPMNLLSRPVFRSGPDVKPPYHPAGDNLYAFQNRPQDSGGWIESPVDSPSTVAHSAPYVVGDQHQGRPLYAAQSAQRYGTEPMTPAGVPLSLSIDESHRRMSAHNSASASPTTTTDPGSPVAFAPRGPAAMYAAATVQGGQGQDASVAFRSYFNHTTGATAYGQAEDDMDDEVDPNLGDQPLSDTLAVLKAHAFGGVRKPRARNARDGGRGRFDD
ncbi:hypothetical protein EXIGLDRAFT_760004 [Exidia glandulosa HHB12029]|uniref:BZIP domain-containing protein n=1 Tax=Exidia glandulosa HHB12029 TaxID=1314781 RepID=A0A165PQA4_EXIGL|nr:hypothetical protein EXIGLDRAFT_760004 [Exidia glandulosa HHB12029]